MTLHSIFSFFFFNDTATTEIYTLSLHDALPIWNGSKSCHGNCIGIYLHFFRQNFRNIGRSFQYQSIVCCMVSQYHFRNFSRLRSEEHTSELQSRPHLVCRLLLEKKKKKKYTIKY